MAIFQLLDSVFEIDSDIDFQEYFRRFGDSYKGLPVAGSQEPVQVVVQEVSAERLKGLTEACRTPGFFHRSLNYKHWNLPGLLGHNSIFLNEEGLYFQWNSPSVLQVYCEKARTSRAPELIYHAFRNMVLWRRSARFAPMLHSSAVEVKGKIWLFLGTKGAGKSTLFAESVFRGKATPFANDRVLLDLERPSQLWSWPSYLSYCEGTIIDYPELRAVFDEYKAPHLQNSDGLYINRYSQTHKKIIPPFSLTEHYNLPYQRSGQAGALVSAKMDPTMTAPFEILKETSSGSLSLEEVNEFCFYQDDPDFPCWHGERGTAVNSENLNSMTLNCLRDMDLPFFQIRMNPITGKDAWNNFLNQ